MRGKIYYRAAASYNAAPRNNESKIEFENRIGSCDNSFTETTIYAGMDYEKAIPTEK
jgi:hypothetical protein